MRSHSVTVPAIYSDDKSKVCSLLTHWNLKEDICHENSVKSGQGLSCLSSCLGLNTLDVGGDILGQSGFYRTQHITTTEQTDPVTVRPRIQ